MTEQEEDEHANTSGGTKGKDNTPAGTLANLELAQSMGKSKNSSPIMTQKISVDNSNDSFEGSIAI